MTTITLTYSAPPTKLQVSFARYMYNKELAISLQIDDGKIEGQDWVNGGPKWLIAQPAVDYLKSASSPAMTDGCGNRVNYTIGFAVCGAIPLTNSTISSYLTLGHDILDHSYTHTAHDDAGDVADIMRNQQRWLTSHNYVFRVGVGPSNFIGYVTAWRNMGYLGALTQSQEPGITQYPTNGNFAATMETLPNGFVHFGRNFADMHDTDQSVNIAKAALLMSKAIKQRSAKAHTLFMQGMHDPRPEIWPAYTQYIQQQVGDAAWVAGMHRILEYREAIALTKIVSDAVAGNVRTIILDNSAIPTIARYRDLSVLTSASGGTLQSVRVNGATNSTYNTSTGLINVFGVGTTIPTTLRFPYRFS
jgi:hypothetical protein